VTCRAVRHPRDLLAVNCGGLRGRGGTIPVFARQVGGRALTDDGPPLAAVEAVVRDVAGQVDPDPAFRVALRARLVAAAGQDPGVSAPRLTVIEGGRRPAAPAAGRWSRWRLACPAAAVAVAAVAGAAVMVVVDARPGTPARSQAAELLVQAPAVGYLEQARRRALEVRAAAGPAGGATARLRTALDDMDAQTRAGVTAIAAEAARSGGGRPELAGLPGWAAEQQTILTAAAGGLPVLRTRLGVSVELLARVAARAADLQAAVTCSCLPLVGGDDLGPVPARAASPVLDAGVTPPAPSLARLPGPQAGRAGPG
jgi:hypothetical protein